MPRTLPWLADSAKKKESKATISSPAPKRKHDSSDTDDLVDDDLNDIGFATPKRKEKKPANRTPSTSPPPAPPSAKYMREGYNADDIYLMVEDEFLSTAKIYTQHIHHAEYVRLKKLARSRGAGTLNAIQRPTDGSTKQSGALRRRLEAEEKDQSIKNGIKKMGDSDESSDAEDEYMHDPQLAGLMTRDSNLRKDLSNLAKSKANTRAAAGFTQSPHNVERRKDVEVFDHENMSEDVTDSDDLDSAPTRKVKQDSAPSEERKTSSAKNRGLEKKQISRKTPPESSEIFKRYAKSPTNKELEDIAFKPISRPTPSKDKDPWASTSKQLDTRSPTKPTMPERLAKRKAERERKEREEKRKANLADDIPTFMI